jgi:hypothetical protein
VKAEAVGGRDSAALNEEEQEREERAEHPSGVWRHQ